MNDLKILVAGLSPAIQKTLLFSNFREGEVNRSEKTYTDAAGKCINVCRVLTQAGLKSECLTVTGQENADFFNMLCRRDRIKLHGVITRGRVRTCTTLIDKGSGVCTEIVANEPEEVRGEEEERYLELYRELLNQNFRAVIVSGSRLPGFSHKIIPEMMTLCKQKGLGFFADYREEDLRNSFQSSEIRPDLIKINGVEFMQTFPEYNRLEEGLQDFSLRNSSTIVISRGREDTLIAEKGRISLLPSKQMKVVNPIGCGDSMTAGIAQGILQGLPMNSSVKLGRDYAARNAMSIHPGWILAE
jgi:tagatose 6-phosphate kinase